MPVQTRLFADKFDYLKALSTIVEYSGKRLSNGVLDVYAIVEDGFFDKLGFNLNKIDGLEFITPSQVTAEFLADLDKDETWFIYAVEHNSSGLDAARTLIKSGYKYSIAGGHPVGGYVYDNLLARQTIEDEYVRQALAGFEKLTADPGSTQDFVNLMQLLEVARNIPGDVVEIGTYRGSSGCAMLEYAARAGIKKTFYFLDTFDGFSYEAAKNSADSVWFGTHRTEGIDTIAERLRSRYDLNPVHVKKVNVIEAFPDEIERISLVNIDVDMYEAVAAALDRVAARIAVGGVIVCEDAGHTPALIGARVALDDFLKSPWGEKYTPVHMQSGQVILVRHS